MKLSGKDSSMIKFSIITVCYNASATISETIASVLGQTYQELEYIVVDGKSSDGTVEMFQGITDARMKFVSENAAIMYGQVLSSVEMEHLLQDLFAAKTPARTPDGKLVYTILEDKLIGDFF